MLSRSKLVDFIVMDKGGQNVFGSFASLERFYIALKRRSFFLPILHALPQLCTRVATVPTVLEVLVFLYKMVQKISNFKRFLKQYEAVLTSAENVVFVHK